MDSQSVKNTDTAGHKGYDAGKKVSGIKRHIAVDTQGLPHGIHVTTADVTDRAGALAMFDENQGICGNRGDRHVSPSANNSRRRPWFRLWA